MNIKKYLYFSMIEKHFWHCTTHKKSYSMYCFEFLKKNIRIFLCTIAFLPLTKKLILLVCTIFAQFCALFELNYFFMRKNTQYVYYFCDIAVSCIRKNRHCAIFCTACIVLAKFVNQISCMLCRRMFFLRQQGQ